ncbi:hypothetical protein ES703_22715 [subsurface metagenome]
MSISAHRAWCFSGFFGGLPEWSAIARQLSYEFAAESRVAGQQATCDAPEGRTACRSSLGIRPARPSLQLHAAKRSTIAMSGRTGSLRNRCVPTRLKKSLAAPRRSTPPTDNVCSAASRCPWRSARYGTSRSELLNATTLGKPGCERLLRSIEVEKTHRVGVNI